MQIEHPPLKIFISYRSTDRRAVEELISDLKDMDYQVWFDRDLEGGQKWWGNLLAMIRACDLLIFALTPKSIDSYPCRLEYTYANALKKHIIPLILTEGIDLTLLPPVLQERQILPYATGDKAEYKALTQAIRALPPTPALPDPLPEPPPLPISPLAPIKTQIDTPTLSYEQQVALVHQLKSYIHDPDHAAPARDLLARLDQHPMLLASVHRDIQAALAATPTPPTLPPSPEPAPIQQPTAADAAPETADRTDVTSALREGEHLLEERYVGLNQGGMMWPGRTLLVTNQRLIFKPQGLSLLYGQAIEIPMQDIAVIKKTLKAMNPAIMLRTKTGEEYFISVGRTGLGNRDKLIALIQKHL